MTICHKIIFLKKEPSFQSHFQTESKMTQFRITRLEGEKKSLPEVL